MKEDRSEYFTDCFRYLEFDQRLRASPNIVYAILKETVPLIPPYLPFTELSNMLFQFVAENGEELQALMFSRAYITDSSVLRKATNKFVDQVATVTLDQFKDGKISSGEPSVRHYGPPYDNVDFPFADK